MNRKISRVLAMILSLLLLCGTVSVAFAADEATKGTKTDFPVPYEFEDVDRLLSFNAKNGTLTISGTGDYINSEKAFWKYINEISGAVKTVKLTKDALLRNRDAAGSDYYLFEKALSALTSAERFVVEEGNADYAERNGVLYDSTVTSLIHYPAGRTDEKYTMESRCMSIRPFAFCNTQHLKFLEFNYSHVLFPMPSLLANLVSDGSRRHFLTIAEYGLGNIDLATGAAKESSIRTLIWYGQEKDLRDIAARHQGNNIVADASISSQATSVIKDLTVFSNRMLFVLGLSKESRNALKLDWTLQLTEAFKDIFSAMGF